jgi:hypothetical protein
VAVSAARTDRYTVRAVLGDGLRPEPEVLAEVNSLNAHVQFGRLWIDTSGTLVLGAEVHRGALRELPLIVESVGESALGVAPFLGALLSADSGEGGDE